MSRPSAQRRQRAHSDRKQRSERTDTTNGKPDVAPLRLHIVRHSGFPFPRAARTLDGRPVTAGFLARGSNVFACLPSSNSGCQWHSGQKLAAHSCGRSRGMGSSCRIAFPCTVTPYLRRIGRPMSMGKSPRRRSANCCMRHRMQHACGRGAPSAPIYHPASILPPHWHRCGNAGMDP